MTPERADAALVRHRLVDFLAGAEYGADATCGNKIAHDDEYIADRTAASLTRKNAREGGSGRVMESYPCVWCMKWHVGRAMEPEEREAFARRLGLD